VVVGPGQAGNGDHADDPGAGDPDREGAASLIRWVRRPSCSTPADGLRGTARIAGVNLERVRPRSEAARTVVVICCWLMPAVLGAVSSLRGWQPPFWFLVAGVAAAAGLVKVFAPAVDPDRVPWWAGFLSAAMVLSAVTLGVAMAGGARLIVLQARGETTVVRVSGEDMDVTERRGRVDEDFCYAFTRLDGSAVSGTICREGREFYLSRTMTIVLDPGGFSGPETPEAVAKAGLWRWLAVGSLLALGVFGVARPWRYRPEPVVPPPLYRTRTFSPRPEKPRPPRRPRRGRRPGAGRRR
jgi:hypothetical protein